MSYRFILGLLTAAICAAQPQQKAGISGTVTSLAGQPLRSAIVRLQVAFFRESGPTGPQPRSYVTSTDALGNFLFENLDPAGYTLSAEHPSYLRTVYGSGSKSSFSVVDVSSGQRLTGLALKMTPQGIIAGRILNEDNEPFPGVRIQLTHWVYSSGRRQLQPVGTGGISTSDADGGFALGNLSAGTYYLSAIDPGSPFLGGILRGHEGPVEGYITTYYPGATDFSGATAIQLAPGAVIRGADIRLRQAALHRVVGRVVDPASSGSPPNVNVLLNPKDSGNLGGQVSRANYDYRSGTFEFSGVLPGVYILQANAMPSGQAGQRSESQSTARQIVTVGNGDLEGVVVQLSPGFEITGQFVTEGPSPPPPALGGITRAPMTINLVSVDVDSLNYNRGGQVKEDGTFAIPGVLPGLYRVEVNSRPDLYLKSARFGGQDVTKTVLDLTSGSGGKLDILLSPNAADISGVVHDPSPDADGAPAVGVTLTLWTPGAPAEGALDFIRAVTTDAKGRFRFAGIPPGEYRIAAWEEIERGLGTVPEFRVKFEDKATAVKVGESDHAQINVLLIPRDAIDAEAAKLK